jgi:hypothetical protein
MCDRIKLIPSFCTAGVTSRLEPDGLAGCYVNIDQCHCLFDSMEEMAIVAPSRADTGSPRRDAHAVAAVCAAAWIQILDDVVSLSFLSMGWSCFSLESAKEKGHSMMERC